ncbi:MAG: hypothetical protein QME12_02225 [Nanoarchaeota archaeon]|nr:hypothetical protein [Nanoarchaeota archaeon]
MAKLKTAIAGLALASILSASAPAKADMFDNVPDYSYVNNSSYVEAHRQESPSEAYARVLENNESTGILKAPFVPQVDLFPTEDLRMPARHITVEDYLEQNNIDYNSQFTTSWWEYPINLAGSYVLTVAWHEFGHYAMANLFGMNNVQMHGPDFETGLVASVSWEGNLGQFQRTIMSAAGMGFTTIGNVSLTSLLQNDVLPDWSRSFAATTSLMMMLDRHRYIWFTGVKHFAGIENNSANDVANIVENNFSSSEGRDAAFGVLMAASAVELALRWEEIWYLMNTIVGRQVEVPEGLGILPGLYPYGSNLMIGASGEF